jgi:hypothetical protein
VQALSRANRTRYEAASDLDARDQRLGSEAMTRAQVVSLTVALAASPIV